jgi:hypothetical protein
VELVEFQLEAEAPEFRVSEELRTTEAPHLVSVST